MLLIPLRELAPLEHWLLLHNKPTDIVQLFCLFFVFFVVFFLFVFFVFFCFLLFF